MEAQKLRQVAGRHVVPSLKREDRDLVVDLLTDGQSVKRPSERFRARGVSSCSCSTSHKPGCGILDSLEAVQCERGADKQGITVVNVRKHQCTDQGIESCIVDKLADFGDATKKKERLLRCVGDMLVHGKCSSRSTPRFRADLDGSTAVSPNTSGKGWGLADA